MIEVTDWRSPCDPRAGRLIVPGDLAALGAPQTAPPPAALSPAAAADSVRSLYAEVLGREPDAAGLAYWVKQLQAGMTRDQLKTAFSASREADRRAAASPSGSAAGQS